MPELVEQMYCSQQIVIPPKFPYILKRYCKAAIKTQPYDLLRWSFEYFRALAERRPPPVKLRLEYPVYSTEGGLTRGCLKVLANQLLGMKDVPQPVLKSAWRGFCLDPNELTRIICLCEAHLRRETIPFLRFIAVAGGLLTKSLTHTMILLCETLTKEPDGGSAAIPVEAFLEMYAFLARMKAGKDVRYMNGYREGDIPSPETESEPEEEESVKTVETQKLRDLSDSNMEQAPEKAAEIAIGEPDHAIEYGEEVLEVEAEEEEEEKEEDKEKEKEKDHNTSKTIEKQLVHVIIEHLYRDQARRRQDLQETFDEISRFVDRYNSANYDLGVVAGRQMSITSGEFIVQNIEREILEYIDEQIAILPDPELKKRKAKPEEVEMVRELLEEIVDDSFHVLAGEVQGIEEEEEGPIPDVIKVYAVPGIGPAVPEDMITDFEDYATDVSRVQANMFMPRNIRHFLCPPLEKYEEYKYNDYKKEEVPTGGTITD